MYNNILFEYVEMISLLSSGDAAFLPKNPRNIKKRPKKIKPSPASKL